MPCMVRLCEGTWIMCVRDVSKNNAMPDETTDSVRARVMRVRYRQAIPPETGMHDGIDSRALRKFVG